MCSEHTVVAWVKDEPCNFDEHSAPFSVKFVLRGRESYYSGTRKYIVTPERLLILDEGRKYSSLTHQDHPSELLSIFFHPSFVKRALAASNYNNEELLDQPECQDSSCGFVERMYQLDPQLQSWLTQFQSALQHEKNNFLINELLIHLFENLILLQKSALKELYPLHAMRATTKMEIYRRLNYVRDFIDSSYSENIELKDCAKVALMSPEYLLRQFKVVFGITPYQYTMQKRLTTKRH